MEGKKPEVYWNRLEKEWEIADAVVVNSEWSKSALVKQGVSSGKIVVIPLAYEAEGGSAPRRNSQGPLHVLWLGSVILRKGIQYLVEAAKSLEAKDVRITVAGPVLISAEAVIRDREHELYRQGDAGCRRRGCIGRRICSYCRRCRMGLRSRSWRR